MAVWIIARLFRTKDAQRAFQKPVMADRFLWFATGPSHPRRGELTSVLSHGCVVVGRRKATRRDSIRFL
jgi:hypothetical protein